MKRDHIKKLFSEKQEKEALIYGWVRTNRAQSQFGFLNINDGSTILNLQVVYEPKNISNFEEVSKFRVGMSVMVRGDIVLTPGAKQPLEMQAKEVVMIGDCPEDFPIQPKRHTPEFLRSYAHLRARTNKFNAVFRIRSVAARAIHEYFQSNGFVYVHTPLITCADCEGSNQMFKISTLDFENLPKTEDGKIDYKQDLFGKQAFITGSGQLQVETFAMAFSDVYTFGPTFRTENSNTRTHANEFWMIEPEMAFCDLKGLMDTEEEMLKFVIKYVMDECSDEIDFCDSFIEKGLKDRLTKLINSDFVRITHHDCVDLLLNSGKKFEFKPSYGDDLAHEHETFLTSHFNGPVFVTDWPRDIKAWYMKDNSDGKTVAAVDLLVPEAGELMGGSQREENYDNLVKKMEEFHIDRSTVDWYLDTRKYGGNVHSGFGMGFERLIMYLTGVDNIRDVIPFPRTPKNCEY